MSLNIKDISWKGPFPHNGRYYRTASLPDGFWQEWKDDRKYLESQGLVPYEENGVWMLALWTDGDQPLGAILPNPTHELPPLPPIETKLNDVELYPPQAEHVQWLVRNLRTWDCDVDPSSVGTGKTAMSLFTAHNLGLTPYVVCPKAVLGSWRKWMLRIGIDGHVINYDQIKAGNWPFCKITKKKRPGYMMYEWCFRNPSDALVIFDEGHVLSGEETKVSCIAGAAKRAGIKTLILSATLAEKAPDLKNVGYLLGLHNWANWPEWLQGLGYKRQVHKVRKLLRTKNGGKFYKEFDGRGDWEFAFGDDYESEVMANVRKSLFPRIGHIVTTEDMKAFMPENEIIPLKVEVKGVAEVYHDTKVRLAELGKSKKRDDAILTKKQMTALQNGEDPSQLKPNRLTVMLRAQQEIELLKVPVVCEMARKELDAGNSVIFICRQRATIAELNERMGGLIINGDTKDRQKVCDDFQADKETVICLQSASGGTGISLHDEQDGTNPRVVYIFPEFSARTVLQSLGRAPRVNGRNKVRQYIVYDANCQEEVKACAAIEKKVKNMESFNGSGSNGIEIL